MALGQAIIDGLSYLAKGFDKGPVLSMAPNPAAQDPTAVMDRWQDSGRINKVVIPKNDRPPYYFRISISNYSRESWLHVGNLETQTIIELPIPLQLVDSHTVNWEAEEIGQIGALMALGTGDAPAGSMARGAGRIGLRALTGLAGNLGGVVGEVGNAVQAKLGYAINNYLTMMLQGPTYKEHRFSWRVSPNSPEESQELINLYRLVNNAQAPHLDGPFGSAFFGYPKIFQMSFHHESGADMGRNLYRFKPAVLRNSQWNFGPNGIAFYGETKAPDSIEFGFNFVELEYWLQGDFDAGPERTFG